MLTKSRTLLHFIILVFKKTLKYRHVILSLSLVSLVLYFYKLLFFGDLGAMFRSEERLDFRFVDAEVTEDGRTAYMNKWVGFPHLAHVDCKAALSKKQDNRLYPKTVMRVAASQIAQDSRNCSSFLHEYGFQRFSNVSQEEVEFPIAFIILFHKDLDQVMHLLRQIYRPHNVYCLSVDLNSDPGFINSVRAVAACFPNVFLATQLEHIVYAGYARLMADIHCMRDLVAHQVRWRYLINMPGQQFPLKTNLEMVKILKIFNGANDMLGVTGKRSLPQRYKIKHRVILDSKTGKNITAETVERNPPPPHNFQIVKGSAYGAFSRAFVLFVLVNKKVWDLIRWSKDIESPDEYVWSTVHHTKLLDVPGGYRGLPEKKKYLTTYVAWENESPCATIHVRWVCIFSTSDLPMLAGRHELFANKFYIDFHPTALHCLDQFLYNLTVTGTSRDLQFYRSLPFVGPHKETGED
ncbi:beta-1,3-galactosyl-O-glycosyl-glycoprotein beta-1,6-N-acetylglucosaminyltransferase-like [Physella acuta]|uniref:beta-1,3-galactosyl-O-glycosyl-glycoprotein beta-1,6-N-acetylglucosaminyltransferase-like n=1 Tax=Physella acuta TaxID=109671 RepID=UPI0027DC056A|nr:beta-1,3-galactosyl-O-glycosyl-glycoprotein beta-1,6-N-acetylglucosaminyltransferase-like [Physella acuta]